MIKYSNGMPGKSKFYEVFREMQIAASKTLADLGLTPAARGFKAASEDDGELEF